MVTPQPCPGRQERAKGLSLLSVLVLISIVMVVAAAMTGVFTLNMNITQKASNGTIALSEAEAGVTEVLYQVTREGNVKERNGKNPEVTWGQSGETIRGTITPEMRPTEAYHVVTFDTKSSFPYSTNNTTLKNDEGYLGRIVPDGMIHVISTGYCKGQYRTVECVLEKPPFPFGLGTSGPVVSVDPITIKGTSTAAAYDPNKDGDRPGHLLCNSKEGVTIGGLKGKKTEISGFVKSAGPVSIAQPAEVKGGIRTYADASTLTDINVASFDLDGQPGVVTIVDSVYTQEQKLDVMYKYSGPELHYLRSVALEKAMLYVDGDLTIDGPVTGEGLIVVNGNAHFKSGTALAGSNKMAVLASGDVTIEGNNNYFMGLVYCEGNLKASNISILGTAIVNSKDNSKGRADLKNVTVISNEETRDMTIQITSSRSAGKSGNTGDGIIPSMSIDGGTFGFHPQGLDANGRYDTTGLVDETNADTVSDQAVTATQALFDAARDGVDLPEFISPPAGLVGRSGGLWSEARKVFDKAVEIQDLKKLVDDKPDDNATQAEKDRWQKASDDFDRLTSDAARAKFVRHMTKLGNDIVAYRKGEASSDGSFKDKLVNVDIKKDVRFNLNEYLPESERVKVSFWKVYSHRL